MRGGGAGVEENKSKKLGRRDIDLGCRERRGGGKEAREEKVEKKTRVSSN